MSEAKKWMVVYLPIREAARNKEIADVELTDIPISQRLAIEADRVDVIDSKGNRKILKDPKLLPPEILDWNGIMKRIDATEGTVATDYCAKCGESPESGTHILGDHAYVRPNH